MTNEEERGGVEDEETASLLHEDSSELHEDNSGLHKDSSRTKSLCYGGTPFTLFSSRTKTLATIFTGALAISTGIGSLLHFLWKRTLERII